MTIYLYKISFPSKLTTKVYIGQTNNPNKRWINHKSYAREGGREQHLYNAIRLYGVDNAKFEIIATCLENTQECGDYCEIQLIEQYDSLKNGYNMTKGGNILRGEDHPNWSKFGSDSPSSLTYKITFNSEKTEIVKGLQNWAKSNGYSCHKLYAVCSGSRKLHRDIIKVEKVAT